MRTVKKTNTLLIVSVIFSLSIAMSSCVLNEGDPQTTLCQKLTAHLMTAENVVWNKARKIATKNKHLQITVGFNNADGSVTEAVCTYGVNDRDEGEDYEVDPDKFVNLPDNMVINDQEVRLQDLHTAIQKVTGQAVKDTLNKDNITIKATEAADVVKEGTIKIKEAAETAAESVTESVKKGAEQLKEKTKDLQHKAGETLEKAGEKLQE